MPDQTTPFDNYAKMREKQEANDRELQDRKERFIDAFNGDVVPKASLDNALAKLANLRAELGANAVELAEVTRERDEAREQLFRAEDSPLAALGCAAENEAQLRATVEALRREKDELTEILEYHRDNVRALDVVWNGEDGAAIRPALIDVLAQIRNELPALRAQLTAQAADMAKVKDERDELREKCNEWQLNHEIGQQQYDDLKAEVARLGALVGKKDAALTDALALLKSQHTLLVAAHVHINWTHNDAILAGIEQAIEEKEGSYSPTGESH